MLWRPFLTGVKVNHRSIYSGILARVYVVGMAMGLVKNKALEMVFVYLLTSCQHCFNKILT